MKHAPYLLRVIAERVLGEQDTGSVTTEQLARHGYDVPTLRSMIEFYLQFPTADRSYHITMTETEFVFRRDRSTSLDAIGPRIRRLEAVRPAVRKAPPVVPAPAPRLDEILRRSIRTVPPPTKSKPAVAAG